MLGAARTHMSNFKNLTIIGTSHISENSIREIESAFRAVDPEIVAVELDRNRLHSLLTNEKPNYSPRLIKEIGLKGYLFALIGGLLQQKLGSIVGVKPGSEMLRAIELARDNQRRIALIDRDVKVTLSRLSKLMTVRERLNLFIDIFRAPFSKKMKINLKEVPEKKLIVQLLTLVKKRYPGLYSALIEERNKFMALRLADLMENYPDKNILVVIGAGHEEGLLHDLKGLTARLK
jgi:pheromone shutdown-related protein TraB